MHLHPNKKTKIIFAAALLFILIISIVTALILNSDTYKNKKEFIEYANREFETNQIFQLSKDTKTRYKYGDSISYAINYNDISHKSVEEFLLNKTNEIVEEFKAESKSQKQNKVNSALIIDAFNCESPNGAVSLAIYRIENHEIKNKVKTSDYIDTFLFDKTSGASIVPEQILKKDYRIPCAEYATRYIEKNYPNNDLNKDWHSYLENNYNNFNKFIITKDGITFYFDENTLLPEKYGIISIKVPLSLIEQNIRDKILDRYVFPDKPMVAITYDDGPGGEAEARIVDCLKRNNAVATFFYYGSRADGKGEQIKQAYDAGCEIGNHTWSHPVLTSEPPDVINSEITRTNELIKSFTGEYPTLFRPSYGESNDTVNNLVGLPVILWNIDTKDWESRNADKVYEAVTKVNDLDGKIVLMHSIYPSTADATERIIPWLKVNGYQTVTVSELIKYKYNEVPNPGKVYR